MSPLILITTDNTTGIPYIISDDNGMPVFHFSAGISHHIGGVYKHGVKMQESSKECSAVSGTGCSSPPGNAENCYYYEQTADRC